jgi:hypothetical protein
MGNCSQRTYDLDSISEMSQALRDLYKSPFLMSDSWNQEVKFFEDRLKYLQKIERGEAMKDPERRKSILMSESAIYFENNLDQSFNITLIYDGAENDIYSNYFENTLPPRKTGKICYKKDGDRIPKGAIIESDNGQIKIRILFEKPDNSEQYKISNICDISLHAKSSEYIKTDKDITIKNQQYNIKLCQQKLTVWKGEL